MDINFLNILFSITIGLVVTHLVFTIFGSLGQVAADFKKGSVDVGDDRFSELYIKMSPETFSILRTTLAGLLFVVGYLAVGIMLALVLGLVGFVLPAMMLNRYKAKRIKKFELQLVEGLELLSNCLRSGMTLPQAMELLIKEFPAPVSQEFALMMSEYRLGVEFTDALENMAKRLNSSIVYILSSGVSITKRCGGDLTQIFGNIAQTIRERSTIEGKLDAVTAQGRFQGMILGLMPFALMVVLYFIDRQHIVTFFTYRLGIMAFFVVCFNVLMAQLWIRKLLKIDV